MKKFVAGLIIGLLLATAGISFAADPIRLIVNGQEIVPDVPPQLIDGRVMVPARFIAEPLGATVEWDAIKNAVVITSVNNHSVSNNPQDAQLVSDWIPLRDIAAIANVIVAEEIYIEKGNIKIVLNPSDYSFTVMRDGAPVETSHAKQENDTTYFPLPILQKYGLR